MPVPLDPFRMVIRWHDEDEGEEEDDFDKEYFSTDGGGVGASSQNETCLSPVGAPDGQGSYFSSIVARAGDDDPGPSKPYTLQRVDSPVQKQGTLTGFPHDEQTITPGSWTYGGDITPDASLSGTIATVGASVETLGAPSCRGPVGGLNFMMAPIEGAATPVEAQVDWSSAVFTSNDDPPRTYQPTRLQSLEIIGTEVAFQVIWQRVT